jgi:hypothetical protein
LSKGIVCGKSLTSIQSLKVPAELGHHGRKLLGCGERHAAAVMQLAVAEEMVEAQAANAECVPLS